MPSTWTGIAERAEPVNVEMIVIVGNLLRRTDASPELRAALFHVAAGIPGIELVGRVVDPAGRTGTAVGIVSNVNGALQRTEIIFDPRTSELLAEETVLLERADWIDADPPATIGYSVYLTTGLVPSTSERP